MKTMQQTPGRTHGFQGLAHRPVGAGSGLGRNVTLLAGIVTIWAARARQRRALAALDEEALERIGVGRAEALKEAAKPYWQA